MRKLSFLICLLVASFAAWATGVPYQNSLGNPEVINNSSAVNFDLNDGDDDEEPDDWGDEEPDEPDDPFEDEPDICIYVEYNPEQGYVSGDECYYYGETVTLTAEPSPGCTFVEWQDWYGESLGSELTYTFQLTGDYSDFFNAIFEGEVGDDDADYYVNVNYNSAMGYVEGDGGYNDGEEVILQAYPKSGCLFSGWVNASTGNLITTYNPLAFDPEEAFPGHDDININAVFEVNTNANCTLSLSYDGNEGSVTALANGAEVTLTGNDEFPSGTEITLAASAEEGYVFSSWYFEDGYGDSEVVDYDDVYDNPWTFTLYGDKSISVYFDEGGDGPDETNYYINVNYNSAMGDVEGFGSYNEDDEVTLQAYPKSGCRFGGWTDSEGTVVSTSNPWIFSAGEDMDINAVFEVKTNANCTLSLSYNGSKGSVTATLANGAEVTLTGNDEFPSGTDVTLTATPANGYFFVNWSDGFPGYSHTLTLYENVELTANFNAIQTVTTGTNSNLVASGRRVNCKFVPEVSGEYTFSSISSNFDHNGYDAFGILYDASMNDLKSDDSGNNEIENEQFKFSWDLTAGQTYYIAAGSYYDYESYNYTEGIVGTITLIIEGPESSIEEEYTVTVNYDSDMGTVRYDGVVVNGEGLYPAGSVTLVASAAQGCRFVAWQDNNENELSTDASYTFDLESNTVLNAVFAESSSEDEYTILVNYDPETGTVECDGEVVDDEEGITLPAGEVTLTASAADTYVFAGWTDEEGNVLSTSASYTFTLSDDIELYAVFEEGGDDEFFSVTVDYDDEMGSVEGDGEHASGSRVTLYAYPEEGYKFVKWEDNNGYELSTNTSYTFTLNGNILFYAVFAEDEGGDDEEYTVTVYYDPEKGTVEYNDEAIDNEDEVTLPAGEVTLIAYPEEGNSFVGWTDSEGNVLWTEDSYTFVLSDDFEINAVFVPEYTVNVYYSSSMGSAEGSGLYASGTEVTLAANPASGFRFVAWKYGNGTVLSNSNPWSFTIEDDLDVYATFEVITYSISVTYNSEMGSVSGAGTYNSGANVTLTATPADGYFFVQWSDGFPGYSHTFTANDNAEYKAEFHAIQTVTKGINSDLVVSGRRVNCVFVPEVGGIYTFKSIDSDFGGSTDSYGALYDDPMDNPLVVDDDGGGSLQFRFEYDLTAGETYYICAGSLNDYENDHSNAENNVGTTTLIIEGPHLVTTSVNDDDYGYVVGDGYYNDGATATLWAYSYDDYEFLRWSDGSNANPHYVTITSDTTFEAIFRNYEDEVYTISASSNNENWGTVTGLSNYVSTQYLYGEKVTLRAVPANDYCHFVQWGDGVTANPRIFNVEESGEYEAIFESDEFTITVSSEHATVSGGGTYYYGDEFTITAEPDEGWFFAYWDFNDGSAFSYANINSASVTGDIDAVAVCREIQEVEIGYNEVYATYRNINCVFRPEVSDTYTFVSDGYGDYMYSYGEYMYGCLLDADMNPLVEKWSNYGYDFKISYDLEAGQTYYIIAGFYNSGNSGRIGLTVSAPITITATSANEEHGYVEGGGTYNYGDYVELEATAADDYEFFRWSNGETENPLGFAAVEDGEYVAIFKPFGANTYYVNANPNIGGWGSVEGSGQYVENDVATLTAKPIPNYHLVQWSDGDKTNPREVIVTDNIELQAEFAVDTFNVSVVADNGEVVYGEGEYAWGEYAYIGVEANTGYHFSYWADDYTTSRTRTYLVQGDATLTAVIEPNYYYVSTAWIGSGEVEGAGSYAYNTEVTLNAVPATGYHFVKWDDDVTTAKRTVTVSTDDNEYTARFEINTYNVTVNTEHGHVVIVTGNGSAEISSDPYYHGTEFTFEAVADTDYKFARWSTSNTTNPYDVTLTSNLVLTPLFIPENASIYELTVSAGEGGSASGSGNYISNEKVNLTATPNEGYSFVKWSTGSTSNPLEYTVTGKATVTAQFAINSYELKVLAGANGTVKGGGTFTYGSSADISATAAEGYHFAKWSDGNTTAERTVTVNNNLELTAEFAINTYAVKATAKNGKVEGTGTYNHGAEATLTAVANTGYHFVKWSDGVTTETRKATVTSELSFTAEFAINSYDVTVSAANGTATGAGSYEYGAKAQLSATAADGYHFVKWSDGETKATRTVVVTEDLAFTAEFAVNTYDVRVSATNGTVEGAGTYNHGAEATLTATANTGFHFTKWSDGVETATRKVTVTDNLSFKAEFAANTYTISVESNDNGTITGAGSYEYGAEATLKATANTGYHFVMWTDSVKNATRTVEVTGNASFSAVFEVNTYELAVKAKNGTVEGAGTYNFGAEATLTATAKAGYRFSKWDDGNTDNPRKVTVTGNKTYTAKFTRETYAVNVNGRNGNISLSSGTLEFGATITLTAVPDSGYHFVMWSDSVLDNPRTVTLTAELLQQVTANGFEFTAIFEKDDNTAVADEAAEAVNIFAYGNTIVVENAVSDIFVYNAMGRLIERVAAEAGRTEIQVNGSGVYIVKTGNTAKRVMIND